MMEKELTNDDWNSYGGDHFHKLCDLLKIDSDGYLKSKDKRGSWRVMKPSLSTTGKLEEGK